MKRLGTRRERATLKEKKLRKRSLRRPTLDDAPLEPEVLTLREKLDKLVSRLGFVVCAGGMIILFNQLRAPNVHFVGRVIDPSGRPVAGASVPWHLEKEGWFDTYGMERTNSQGYFVVSGRRLAGQRLKIGEIDMPGYHDVTTEEDREFRFGWFAKDRYVVSRDRPVFQVRRDEMEELKPNGAPSESKTPGMDSPR